jgi:hypothetical protein
MDRKARTAWVGWIVVALLPLSARVAGADHSIQPQASQPGQQIVGETVRGTVQSVGTFRVEGTSEKAVRLRIKTEDGKVVTIRTAPHAYLERRGIRFHRGDQVVATGSPAKAGRRNVIVAAQIERGDKTVALRTREGEPLWSLDDLRGPKESARPKKPERSFELRHAYEW